MIISKIRAVHELVSIDSPDVLYRPVDLTGFSLRIVGLETGRFYLAGGRRIEHVLAIKTYGDVRDLSEWLQA
jgi:hypothetical protein